MKTIFVVVAYDIVSDRRRNMVVKVLKDYGVRVNYSVFECEIKRNFFPVLKEKLEAMIDKKQDSVLFYKLCMECQAKRDAIGTFTIEPAKDIISI